MNTILIVLAISIILLIVNIYIDVSIDYNILDNLGVLKLKLFGIRIINIDFTIVLKHLEKLSTKKGVKKFKIDFTDKSFLFFKILFSRLKNKIVLRKCEIISDVYLENVMATSIIGGTSSIIVNYILATLKDRYYDATITGGTRVDYRHKLINIKIGAGICITLFDIFVSIILAIYILWRWSYEIKRGKAKVES